MITAPVTFLNGLTGVGPFEVGYFAWPITDNTKLQDFRVSILLLAGGDSEAKIRVIGFHSDLAADRFDVKELTRTLPQFDHSSK